MREAPQLDEKRIDLVALAVCSARTASQAHEAMVWGPLVPLANIELDFQLPSPSPVEARVRKQGPLGEAVTSSGSREISGLPGWRHLRNAARK